MSSKKDNKKTRNRKYYREVQENLYRCRDLEISNLWQRSIFVSSIVILCYTGYGVLFSKAFENADVVIKMGSGERELFRITNDYSSLLGDFHLYLGIICIIGVVFSVMYVLMAKASKAWQEAYENAISDLEYYTMYHNLEYVGYGDFYKRRKGWFEGSYLYLNSKDVNSSVFVPLAGCYSPSKINIMLGVISCCLFTILNIVHFTICGGQWFSFLIDNDCWSYWVVLIIVLLFWFFVYNVLFGLIKEFVRSSELEMKCLIQGKDYTINEDDSITPTDSEVDVSVDVSINDNSETSNNRKH